MRVLGWYWIRLFWVVWYKAIQNERIIEQNAGPPPPLPKGVTFARDWLALPNPILACGKNKILGGGPPPFPPPPMAESLVPCFSTMASLLD